MTKNQNRVTDRLRTNSIVPAGSRFSAADRDPAYRGGGGGWTFSDATIDRYLATVRSLGAVACYPMQESAGLVCYDPIGGYNLAYNQAGHPLLNQSGLFGKPAAKFLSTSPDRINTTSALCSVFPISEGTIVVPCQPEDSTVWANSNTCEFAYFQADSSNRIFLRKNPTTGTISLFYVGGGVSKAVSSAAQTGAGARVFSASWSKSNDRLSLYIDGVLIGSNSSLGTLAAQPVTGTSQIGVFWSGIMPYVSIYPRELNQGEIAAISIKSSNIIIEGDSRSQAADWVSTAMSSALVGGRFAWSDFATSGANISVTIAGRAAQVDALFNRQIRSFALLWAGVNEWAIQSYDPAAVFAQIKNWHMQRRSAGHRTIAVCEIDAQGTIDSRWHSGGYEAINAMIRADRSFYDVLIDPIAVDSRFADATNTAVFEADQVHPNAAGNSALAAVFASSLSTYCV